jgi:membrane protein YqaA with SNARE-associated domain
MLEVTGVREYLRQVAAPRFSTTRRELSAIASAGVKLAPVQTPRATMPAMDESSSLWTLFATSFLAATLLPGGSEFVLAGVLHAHPQLYWPALLTATLGNTLGGMSSYLIGRVLPQRTELKGLKWVQRFGSLALLAAWVPIIGDPLCVAAGWLRLNPWLSALFMAIGKVARYLVIAAAVA